MNTSHRRSSNIRFVSQRVASMRRRATHPTGSSSMDASSDAPPGGAYDPGRAASSASNASGTVGRHRPSGNPRRAGGHGVG